MNKIIICDLEKQNKTLYGLLTSEGLEQICLETMQKKVTNSDAIDDETKLPVGTIAIARVNKVVSGLRAAFVTINQSKQEYFLPINHLKVGQVLIKRQNKTDFENEKDYDLISVLKGNDEILVQVTAEAQKMKQPIVEAQITFKGTYSLLKTGVSSVLVSNKIAKKYKNELKENEQLNAYGLCYGLTIRTETQTLLEANDLAPLLEELKVFEEEFLKIEDTFYTRKAGHIFVKGRSKGMTALQDMLSKDVDEIVVDNPCIYQELISSDFNLLEIPVRFYQDDYALYKLYSIENTLKQLLDTKVWLKSGGFLMIEPTEALTVIDVNSGKNSKGADLAFEINYEAINAIAYQMRARNLTGMILIDFINVKSKEQELELIERMRLAMKKDYVKHTVYDITKLGLMEITREKRYPTLKEQMKHEVN